MFLKYKRQWGYKTTLLLCHLFIFIVSSVAIVLGHNICVCHLLSKKDISKPLLLVTLHCSVLHWDESCGHNGMRTMSIGINIYSELLISRIRIVDIKNCNSWYQQFEFLISWIPILDMNNLFVDIKNSNSWYQQFRINVNSACHSGLSGHNWTCGHNVL